MRKAGGILESMTRTHRRRLMVTILVVLFGIAGVISQQNFLAWHPVSPQGGKGRRAHTQLEKLAVKGRAPKTGYQRAQFGDGWAKLEGCDMRNIILARDLTNERVDAACKVLSGELDDPYTGKIIYFTRGAGTSGDVQIDHVVALSDAWQKGAQQLTRREREALANDPLNLLAVDGAANQQKSDGDAATWLPTNKSFRCQYVVRQIEVKVKYRLWVTAAEKQAMQHIVGVC